MIRILIAGDHVLIREGLKRVLGGCADVDVAAECGDGDQVLFRVQREAYDVLLLDLSLPGMSGLEVLHALHSGAGSGPPVVAISLLSAEAAAHRALQAGAAGCVCKGCGTADVVEAIRRAHAGGRFVCAEQASRLDRYVGRGLDQPPGKRLSAREFHILLRLVTGETIEGIALDLSLSPSTVKTYRQRIQGKLGLRVSVSTLIEGPMSEVIEGAGAFPVSASR